MTTYEPTTFAKGDQRKVARSAREAVALKFDGFKQVEEASSLQTTTADAGDNEYAQVDEAQPAPSTELVRENDDDLNTSSSGPHLHFGSDQ